MTEKEKALSTLYFSKEFPSNWEVEWKANLATLDSAGFIFKAYDLVAEEQFFPFVHPKSLGELLLGMRYFDVWFHYFGHQEEKGWVEDFVLAQPPEFPIFIPRIKIGIELPHLNTEKYGVSIRQEIKVGLKGAFHKRKLESFKQAFEAERGIESRFLGTLRRERYSFYLSNSETCRNWSLVADRSQPINPIGKEQIAQIEIEYKGRDGISLANPLAQRKVLEEMDVLGKIVASHFGSQFIQPTKLTKFEWLINLLHY